MDRILLLYFKIIAAAEKKLKNNGRILVRYSGTESLLRIMVEGENEKLIDSIAEQLLEDLSSFFNNIHNDRRK